MEQAVPHLKIHFVQQKARIRGAAIQTVQDSKQFRPCMHLLFPSRNIGVILNFPANFLLKKKSIVGQCFRNGAENWNRHRFYRRNNIRNYFVGFFCYITWVIFSFYYTCSMTTKRLNLDEFSDQWPFRPTLLLPSFYNIRDFKEMWYFLGLSIWIVSWPDWYSQMSRPSKITKASRRARTCMRWGCIYRLHQLSRI